MSSDKLSQCPVKNIISSNTKVTCTVEMECAALAACAQFRKIDFAQILFTADSLADINKHDNRNWGKESHRTSLEVGMKILTEF